MIVVAGSVKVKPEAREKAVQVVLKMVAETKKEEGCLMYDFYADLADPNTFFVFEEWETQAHLDRHIQTPHMAEFLSHLPELVEGKSSIKRYVVAEAAKL